MRLSSIFVAALAGAAVLAPQPAPAARATALLARLAAEQTPRATTTAFRNARRALGRLAAEVGDLDVHWDTVAVRPAVLRGLTLAWPGDSLAARARGFLSAYAALVLSDGEALDLVEQRGTQDRAVLRFARRFRGVPVLDREVRVAFDGAGRLRAVHGDGLAIALSSVTPAVDARAAYRIAAAKLGAPAVAAPGPQDARLVILAEGTARLVYAAVFPMSIDPRGRIHLVDAQDGRYVGWRPGVLFDPLPRQEVRR